MAPLLPSLTRTKFNFPPKLDRGENADSFMFPADLLGNNARKFYTQIEFVNYDIGYQFSSAFTPIKFGGIARPSPGSGIKLPIPLKIDDNYVLSWSEVSLTNTLLGMAGAAGKGLQVAAGFGGIAFGEALNPLMFLQFQRPEYKQFSFSWLLTPRNEDESRRIRKIIKRAQKAAAPGLGVGGLTLKYPQVALIKMHPDNLFENILFKPCVITSVQTSYIAGPNPAFHKGGAPAVISFTINLMEMQFWYESEIKVE